jgi:hypothetical protein
LNNYKDKHVSLNKEKYLKSNWQLSDYAIQLA